MTIGIDISQIVYTGSGVATYVTQIVKALVQSDFANDYVLFAGALHHQDVIGKFYDQLHARNPRTKLVLVPLSPKLLDFLWNRLHIIPIEWFVGQVDIFWSSDWTQPPLAAARGITTIHDVSFFHHPESFADSIVQVQTRRLTRAKTTCDIFFCDSVATKNDVSQLLGIDKQKLFVVYPGIK